MTGIAGTVADSADDGAGLALLQTQMTTHGRLDP
jgi:hypothetical protein